MERYVEPQYQQIHPGDVLVVVSDRQLTADEEPEAFCTTALAEMMLRHMHLSAEELTELGKQLINEQCATPWARSLLVVKRAEA